MLLRGVDDFITGEDENEEEDDFKATEVEKNDEQRIYDKVYSYLTASCYWVARSSKVAVNFVVNPAVVTYHHGKLQESTLVDKVLPR